MQFKDLSNQYFGKWFVIDRAPNNGRTTMFNCRCECGTERTVAANNLSNGATLSCGCDMVERISEANTKHGMRHHPAYASRGNMLGRCYNPNNPKYKSYGARGITVCQAWRDSFEAFWADMGPTWQQGLTIERIDNDGNYEPSNCTWIPKREQAANKQRTRRKIIETPLGSMSVDDAAKHYNLSRETLHTRVKAGCTGEDLVRPVWHSRKA